MLERRCPDARVMHAHPTTHRKALQMQGFSVEGLKAGFFAKIA
jgi:hypothetical protein